MISSQNSQCKWVRINHKEPKYLHFVSIFVRRNRRGKVVLDLIEENSYTRQKEFTGKGHRPICEQQLNMGKILPNPIVCCCSAAQLCLTLCDPWLQHARLPCPSLSPGVCSNSCPLKKYSKYKLSKLTIHGAPFQDSP